jgi:peptide/nickel transport system permease protein
MTAPVVVPATAAPSAGAPTSAWRRLRADRTAMLALALLVLLVLAAALAPVLAPYDPHAQPDIVGMKNLPPSARHPFGTDPFSRDVLSRVLWGAQVSLGVGVLAGVLATTLGTAKPASA